VSFVEFLTMRILEDEVDIRSSRMDDSPEWWMPDWLTPDRLLAEIAAKRAILAAHRRIVGPHVDWHGGDEPDESGAACSTCGYYSEYAVRWPCETLERLAVVYAGHPDYDEEWRP
jgi:hypothetical protein